MVLAAGGSVRSCLATVDFVDSMPFGRTDRPETKVNLPRLAHLVKVDRIVRLVQRVPFWFGSGLQSTAPIKVVFFATAFAMSLPATDSAQRHGMRRLLPRLLCFVIWQLRPSGPKLVLSGGIHPRAAP